MNHKKIIIPVICLCLVIPASVMVLGSKKDSNFVQKIKRVFVSKTISNKSTDITVGMSPQKSEADFSSIAFDDEFKHADYTFTLGLMKNEISETDNVIISPYSAIQSLGMLENGADGNTLTEIEAAMGGLSVDKLNGCLCKWREKQSNEKSQLTMANSLWIIDNEELIKPVPQFLQTAVDYYAPNIYTTPFDKHTRDDINAWINQNIEGYISKALDDIDPNAVMYLVNAVEFDAKWREEYLHEAILHGVFTDYSGKEQNAEMLTSNESLIIEDDHATGFVRYYRDEKYAFVAILPEENMTVNEYIEDLTPEHFGELMAVSKIKEKDWQSQYTVSIPKFKYAYKTDLGDSFKEMGIKKAFIGEEADFSRISSASNNPYLSRVIHDTYIQFDEKGTKAAAASLHEENVSAAIPMYENRLVFNRPFLYAIVDTETDMPLFVGTLMSIPE